MKISLRFEGALRFSYLFILSLKICLPRTRRLNGGIPAWQLFALHPMGMFEGCTELFNDVMGYTEKPR